MVATTTLAYHELFTPEENAFHVVKLLQLIDTAYRNRYPLVAARFQGSPKFVKHVLPRNIRSVKDILRYLPKRVTRVPVETTVNCRLVQEKKQLPNGCAYGRFLYQVLNRRNKAPQKFTVGQHLVNSLQAEDKTLVHIMNESASEPFNYPDPNCADSETLNKYVHAMQAALLQINPGTGHGQLSQREFSYLPDVVETLFDTQEWPLENGDCNLIPEIVESYRKGQRKSKQIEGITNYYLYIGRSGTVFGMHRGRCSNVMQLSKFQQPRINKHFAPHKKLT